MIKRDENGIPVSAEHISDITAELKDIEKKVNAALKKGDSLSDEEKAKLTKAASQLKPLFDIVTPDLQKKASPMEMMNYLKQVLNIKKLSDKLQELKND